MSENKTALWLVCRLTMTGTSWDTCPSRHIWVLFEVEAAEKEALGQREMGSVAHLREREKLWSSKITQTNLM